MSTVGKRKAAEADIDALAYAKPYAELPRPYARGGFCTVFSAYAKPYATLPRAYARRVLAKTPLTRNLTPDFRDLTRAIVFTSFVWLAVPPCPRWLS